jgi:hypothetical protein
VQLGPLHRTPQRPVGPVKVEMETENKNQSKHKNPTLQKWQWDDLIQALAANLALGSNG